MIVMKVRSLYTALLATGALCGCASLHSDRFYVLNAFPSAGAASQTAPSVLTTLHVTIPSMSDRNELVLRTNEGVKIMEHERWAAPLADQITLVLGQDLERRRNDLLIATSRVAGEAAKIAIAVDIVDLQVRQGIEVNAEVRWRVKPLDGNPTVGRDTFTCPARGGDYQALAAALSSCVGQLTDKLVGAL
jgi:uncharacterized protein